MSALEGALVVGVVLAGAAVFAWAVKAAARRGSPGPGGGGFLCDRCKYNDVRYCDRPERPNASTCPDFKAR